MIFHTNRKMMKQITEQAENAEVMPKRAGFVPALGEPAGRFGDEEKEDEEKTRGNSAVGRGCLERRPHFSKCSRGGEQTVTRQTAGWAGV